LFGLLFLSTLLSQPFLYGGEARTAATVILYMHYIIVYALYNLIEYIKKKQSTQFAYREFQLKFSKDKNNTFIYTVPILVLSFFLFKGLMNNFNYLTDIQEKEYLSCPEGSTLKNMVFNDKSGFYINDSKSDRKKYQKDFSDVLDYYSDLAVLAAQAGTALRIDTPIDSMGSEEAYKRDSFRFLKFLVPLSDYRLFGIRAREKKFLQVIGNVYLLGGGFFIHPINKKSKSTEGLVIFREDMLKKGFNDISICL